MKAQVNLSQVLQGGLAALVAWLFNTVNTLQSQVAVYDTDTEARRKYCRSSYERKRTKLCINRCSH